MSFFDECVNRLARVIAADGDGGIPDDQVEKAQGVLSAGHVPFAVG